MKTSKTTSWIVRIVLILLVLALAVFLYHYGKEHKIYVDNRSVEIDGVKYDALDWAEYSVDGAEPVESYPRMRDSVTVQRQKHSLHILWEDWYFNQFERDIEFELPLNTYEIVLSLPAVAAGLEPEKCLIEFVPMSAQMAEGVNQKITYSGDGNFGDEDDFLDDFADDGFGDFGMDF